MTNETEIREAFEQAKVRLGGAQPSECKRDEWWFVEGYTAAMQARARLGKGERLCDDEGCEHYGTKHECIVRFAKPVEVGELVEALARLEDKIANIPVGEESHERGSSYYNWGRYWLTQFKAILSRYNVTSKE